MTEIEINHRFYDYDEPRITGRRVIELTGWDPDLYDAFYVSGQDNIRLKNNESVTLSETTRFYVTIRSALYG